DPRRRAGGPARAAAEVGRPREPRQRAARDRGRDHLPPLELRELRHGPGPRRRRRPGHVLMGTRPQRNISGSTQPLPTTLTWSETLRKRVRTGDWQDQKISTTRKIQDAIRQGEWELAAQ